MRLFRLFFFIFFLSFFAHSNSIKEIEITGLDSISRGTVLSYLPVEVGDVFDEKISDDIIRSLYRTKLFSDIALNFSNDVLKVSITENPTIKYFRFSGYDTDSEVLTEEVNEKLLKNFNLEIGSIFSSTNLLNLIQTVKELYKDNAFYSADISSKEILDATNRLGIEIIVNEGERALVSSFKISGNTHFDEDELLDLFDFGTPDFFLINWFTRNDEFNQNLFDAGLQKITKKYVDSGYLDFDFIDKAIILNKDNNINISLKISEGSRYQIENLTYDFVNSDFIDDDISSFDIKLKEGDFFNRIELIKELKKIESFYANKGFAYTLVDSKLMPNKDTGKISIKIAIDKKQLIYIDRINISGNNKTQDDVIRRELNFYEGQYYSKDEIETSLKRIKRLGYFSKVDSNFSPSSDGKVNVFIEVEETDTGEISFGVSQSNTSGTSVTAGIQQKNVLGTGNTFNANFSNSDAVEELSFFFSDPYFLDTKQELSYGFISKKIDGASLDVASYKIDENSYQLGYGYPTSEFSELSTSFKISSLDLQCGSSLSNLESQCSNNDSSEHLLTFKFSHNTLDNYFFPEDGEKITSLLKFALPSGDFQYYSMENEYKKYSKIFDDKTFKYSANISFGGGYGSKDYPFFKRFYGGGSSSVRGYDFNSLGPKYSDGTSKGGELSINSNVSLISPLNFIDNSEQMRIAAFVDFGGISEDITSISSNDFRASTGIAFNWFTPIGPLGVFLAQPVNKKVGDQTETFGFTIGTSF